MTILYVIAHSIEAAQISANAGKITRAMKMLFSNGMFYVYLDDPRPWDNSYFNAQRMREQRKLMNNLLGDLFDDEKLSVHKFVGKQVSNSFNTHEDADGDE